MYNDTSTYVHIHICTKRHQPASGVARCAARQLWQQFRRLARRRCRPKHPQPHLKGRMAGEKGGPDLADGEETTVSRLGGWWLCWSDSLWDQLLRTLCKSFILQMFCCHGDKRNATLTHLCELFTVLRTHICLMNDCETTIILFNFTK